VYHERPEALEPGARRRVADHRERARLGVDEDHLRDIVAPLAMMRA
jgi:hypothetical protein